MTDLTATRPTAGTVATRDDYLSDNAWRRIERSVPESTRRAYEGDLGRYLEWCIAEQRTPVPATGETIADYASHLADGGKAPSTIDRAMAAISKAHELAGQPKPVRTLLAKVLRGYRQEYAANGGAVRKAAAVSVNALRVMVATLDPEKAVGVRDRAILVIGFALAARRSEIAALDLADVTPHDEGVQVIIRKSKTDQDARGRTVALPYGSNVDTCPVRALRDWTALLASVGRTEGPLFVRIDKHGVIGRSPDGQGGDDGRIVGATVARIVRRIADVAGLDASQAFSGHSLRRGFATAAYSAPEPDVLRIARHGGWKDGSSTLLGYIEEVDRWRKNPLAGIGL